MTAPASVDEYLAALPQRSRTALESVRGELLAAAPDATETISYGMPALRAHGRLLVSYAAFARHWSLFPMSAAVVEAYTTDLAPYYNGVGTLRFPYDKPVPAALLAGIVRMRLEENAARARS